MQGLPRRPQGPHVARSARFLFFISSLAKPSGGRWLLEKIGFLLRRSYPGAVGREARRLSRMTCLARTRQCANARAAEGICNPELVERPVRRFRPLSTLRALRKILYYAIFGILDVCVEICHRKERAATVSGGRASACPGPFSRLRRYPPRTPCSAFELLCPSVSSECVCV